MTQVAPPKHVAIIMDGNGRWANKRSHSRIWGHIRGASKVSEIVDVSLANSVEVLTLYAFSTENWNRPSGEVKTLFKLLAKFLKVEKRRILDNGIRFRAVGNIDEIPRFCRDIISDVEKATESAIGLQLNFAINYGGRAELVAAMNKVVSSGDKVTEESITSNLYNGVTTDVDLLIRTGGNKRISNFLIWQSAYAELFFSDTPWPEFGKVEFQAIIDRFQGIDRRFGAVKGGMSLEESQNMAQKNKNVIS